MPKPIVFFDIAGPDMVAQKTFYESVFGWEIGLTGSVTAPVGGPSPGRLSGTLRTDQPDCLLYFGVADVTAALAQVVAHGGKVGAQRFEVPGVVVLGLFSDPAGNRMGLVEMDGDQAKVP